MGSLDRGIDARVLARFAVSMILNADSSVSVFGLCSICFLRLGDEERKSLF